MAKLCFCGCGRKVRFGRRPMNTSGKRITTALARIDATAKPLLEAQGSDGPELENFIAGGQDLRAELIEIVHEERDPKDFDVPRMRYWLRLAHEAEGPALLASLGARHSPDASDESAG